MNKKLFKTITIAAVLCVLWPTSSAFAKESYDDKLSNFANALPYYVNKEKLDKSVQEIAQYHHWSKEKVLDAEMELLQNPNINKYQQDKSSSPATIALPNAQHRGDFYFTPAGLHGHTGIYSQKNKIVEAVGSGEVAREKLAFKTLVAPGAIIRSVNTSNANRAKAADRARTYIGRGYNSAFFQPHKNDWGGLHCAQLVWASYKYGAGIDIDDGNDELVWPWDLEKTTKATTYRKL